MDVLEKARAANAKPDLEALVAALPYARFIGLEVDVKGREVTFVMPFRQSLVGNPLVPALHGGVIGGLLELAATIELAWEVTDVALAKPVDINISYLRPGRTQDTYARARVLKQGRRVAHVSVEAWQEEREKPIATLHGHFLLKAPENGASPKA